MTMLTALYIFLALIPVGAAVAYFGFALSAEPWPDEDIRAEHVHRPESEP